MKAANARHVHSQLTNQLLRNGLLMILSRAAGIVTVLLSVPVIIHYLGAEGFGIWESLLAIGTSAMITQTVISSTILWRISACFGVGDHQESRRLVRLGMSTVGLLLAATMPLIWSFRLRIVAGLQLSMTWRHDAEWVMPLLVATMLLGGINQILISVVSGYQRAGVAALVQTLGLISTNAAAILILLFGGGLQALLFGYLVGFVAMLLILFPIASRLCGGLSLIPTIPNRKDLATLGPFAGLVLLSNLALVFRDQTDKLLLSSMDSPVVTGYFGIGQRMAGMIMQTCMVVYTPLTATIGAQFAAGDWNAIEQIYLRSASWMVALAGLLGVLVTILRTPLLVFWLGHDQPECHVFLAIAVFSVVSAITFSGPGVALAKGIGRPGLETFGTMLTLALVLLSKPLLIARYGAIGGIVSSSGSWVLGSIFFLFVLHRCIKLPRRVVQQTTIGYLIAFSMSCIGWLLTEYYPLISPDRVHAFSLLLLMTPFLAAVYIGALFATGVLDGRALWSATRERLPQQSGYKATEQKERYEAEIPYLPS